MSNTKAIYYFSATGNSLVVARDLAKELGGADLLPITKAVQDSGEVKYETIGIVFPAYMFGLPLIVADFARNISITKGSYVFAVATYGGIPGRPISMIRDILAKRGINLSAGFGVRMPGNYTPLYEAIPDAQQKDMFAREKSKVKDIASLVNIKAPGPFEEERRLVGTILHALLHKGGSSQIPRADSGFWVNDKCTSCGLCARVCPVGDIEIKDKRPQWLGHCQHCMACLQWCPVEAIQYKKNTPGRKRYRHPLVTADDIISQQAKELY
ncbi:MAG: EFR1 family ferrodoxin [Candidatus Omnitrophica bacterium]|nr:EFR1 family ferrodoxin [Candidatus Omnitrophota bacterium]